MQPTGGRVDISAEDIWIDDQKKAVQDKGGTSAY